MNIIRATTTTVIEYELGEEVDAEVYPLYASTPVTIHVRRLRVTTTDTTTTVEAYWYTADRWAEATPGARNTLLRQLGEASQ